MTSLNHRRTSLVQDRRMLHRLVFLALFAWLPALAVLAAEGKRDRPDPAADLFTNGPIPTLDIRLITEYYPRLAGYHFNRAARH